MSSFKLLCLTDFLMFQADLFHNENLERGHIHDVLLKNWGQAACPKHQLVTDVKDMEIKKQQCSFIAVNNYRPGVFSMLTKNFRSDVFFFKKRWL